MNKTCLYILSLFFLINIFTSNVIAAEPHLEFSPASGSLSDSGTEIDIVIDTGGEEVKSAKAVINFDSSKLEVSSVADGDFFENLTNNIYNNQVIINANLEGVALESKTGRGTLAILTVKPLASSGEATLVFDCVQGDSTDSGINDPTPTDIIECSSNINASYSLSGTSSSPSPSPSSSPSPSPAVGGPSSPAPSPSTLPESGTTEYTFALIAFAILFIVIGTPALILK